MITAEIIELVRIDFDCGSDFQPLKGDNQLSAYKCPECGEGKIVSGESSAPRKVRIHLS